jgi:phosphatidylglycerophosphate synthase
LVAGSGVWLVLAVSTGEIRTGLRQGKIVAIRKSKKSVIKKPSTETAAPPAVEAPAPLDFNPAFCIVGDHSTPLFGLTSQARIREQFRRANLTHEIALENRKSHHGPMIMVNAASVIDQPLIAAVLKRPNLAITSEKETGSILVAAHVRAADADAVVAAMSSGEAFSRPGIVVRAPSDMEANFWQALRKRETPYALPLTETNQADVEWRMFMGTYKGATDLVTKHVWPVPAFHVTRWLAPRGITPNMVTTVGAIMTIAAFFLFLYGQFAWGLLAAWAMTFLDTVDGKLARTTLTSSKWGDVFDHGIDLVHPPFWYMAWGCGLAYWGISWNSNMFWGVMAVIFGGYILQRLIEGAAIKWLGLEIHIWRRVDTFFRQITARRNPNLILLTLAMLVARPDWGLLAVAAWTAICLVLHAIQLLQAFSAQKAEGTLTSWMTKP